jgi:hypothetical protein
VILLFSHDHVSVPPRLSTFEYIVLSHAALSGRCNFGLVFANGLEGYTLSGSGGPGLCKNLFVVRDGGQGVVQTRRIMLISGKKCVKASLQADLGIAFLSMTQLIRTCSSCWSVLHTFPLSNDCF